MARTVQNKNSPLMRLRRGPGSSSTCLHPGDVTAEGVAPGARPRLGCHCGRPARCPHLGPRWFASAPRSRFPGSCAVHVFADFGGDPDLVLTYQFVGPPACRPLRGGNCRGRWASTASPQRRFSTARHGCACGDPASDLRCLILPLLKAQPAGAELRKDGAVRRLPLPAAEGRCHRSRILRRT